MKKKIEDFCVDIHISYMFLECIINSLFQGLKFGSIFTPDIIVKICVSKIKLYIFCKSYLNPPFQQFRARPNHINKDGAREGGKSIFCPK